MQDPLWSATYDLFQDVQRLLDKAAGSMGSGSRGGSIAAPVGSGTDFGLRRAFVATGAADLVKLRQEVRGRLDVLRSRLLENLTEREVYLVLFPIVLYLDESVQKGFPSGLGQEWPPLQKELFSIDDGGDAFYEQMDDLLRKPNTFPFIYQVYYLCLSAGFSGRHHAQPTKIAEYKGLLTQKIPMPEVEAGEGEQHAAPFVIERFPVRLYAGAFLLVVCVFLLLRVLDGI